MSNVDLYSPGTFSYTKTLSGEIILLNYHKHAVLKVVSILPMLLFTLGCPTLNTGQLGAPFTLLILPPIEGGSYFIEQGGSTDFEVGVEQLSYEVQMNGSFSSDALLAVISDIPVGLRVEASSVISLNMPFALEPDATFVHLFTIWADENAQLGINEMTITVSGVIIPGGEIATQSNAFIINVIERS